MWLYYIESQFMETTFSWYLILVGFYDFGVVLKSEFFRPTFCE